MLRSLTEVKSLFNDKFGCSAGEDSVVENDVKFVQARGTPSLARMLSDLSDVKSKFADKFGHSVDSDVVCQDGVAFVVSRGAPPSMDKMFKQLDELKDVFEETFG